MADHPDQIHLSPYAYGWNNPTNLTDPDGNCPGCAIYAARLITYVAAAALAAVSTYMIVSTAKQLSNNGAFYTSAQDNTSVSQPKLQPVLKTEGNSEGTKSMVNSSGNVNNGEDLDRTKHTDNRHVDRTKYPDKSKYKKPSQETRR